MTDVHGKPPASKIVAPTGGEGSRSKGAVSNAGWNGFSTLWSGVVSFLLTPLMIHYLGVTQYGILLLIWSFTGTFGLLNLGLGEATLRYVAYHFGNGDLRGVNRVFGSTISFYAFISVLLTVLMLAFAPLIVAFLNIPAGEHRMVGWLLVLSALEYALGIFSRAYGAIPMALQRYDISSKINIGQSVVRSGGYILLLVSRFGILHLVLWDVATYAVTLVVQAAVVRKLSPGVSLFPSFSFKGLREIFGYSVFSLLTTVFYTMFRESGKLMLGRYLGPSPVAYLGTPDNVGQRVHGLVASSSETLMPRFSANREPEVTRKLFLGGTWAAMVFSVIIFIPMVVLMPDFLRLWINPQFSMESAAVGQLLALSYILQGAFAPAAAYFRGIGMPWVVSIVLLFAGVGALLACLLLIPAYGVLGAGYAYLIGSLAHFLGLVCGWFYVFGRSSISGLLRAVCLPLLLAGGAFTLESIIRHRFAEVNWIGLFALGGMFVGVTTLLVIGVDWVLGGDSPSKRFCERIGESDKFRQLLSYIPAWRVR